MSEKNKEKNISRIEERNIVEEMRDSYIDYAMSVIVSRALPDVRDGMKPVHRRILYTMYEDKLFYNTGFRKSATVVGSCLSKYHPHGDMAVYDSLVRMAQKFSLRYPLIISQGNFGSIDGDPPAAQRYTECKLSEIGQDMLRDIEKGTVNFAENYDGTRKEPMVLTSPAPQLLLNGAMGIAVGMATNIPPHNLSEVCDATYHLVDNPNAETTDLFQWIQGPDFPTGGKIFNQKEIISAYSQGKGKIVSRGKADIEKLKNGKVRILITEIPYQVQKSILVLKMADLVTGGKIKGVKDIRDLSDRDGMRIIVDVKKGFNPKRILNRLYKFTDLQKNFNLNLLALVDGIQPRILSLSEVLSYFIEHRKEVVTRRTKFDLEKAKARAHILEGLSIALKNIDAIIETIKKSENRDKAKANLIKKFRLSDLQAEAILQIRLQSLVKLEHEKIDKELKELAKIIKELTSILKSPQKIKEIIKEELKEMKEKYGDERRTKLIKGGLKEINEEDLVPMQEVIITLTKGGYIKRINPSTYKIQKRGGKGIVGMKTMEGDMVEHFLFASTHDDLLFFTDSGKAFQVKAYEIPEAKRVARGRGLFNFLEISSEEKVLSVIPMKKEEEEGIKYLLTATKDGKIKKTGLDKFKNIRKNGIIAIKLGKNDSVRRVVKTTGNDEVVLVTKKGKLIRFHEKEAREMGRGAAGVKGIRLTKGDEVVSADVVGHSSEKKEYLLVVTENGYGKRTEINKYNAQNRGGSGIKTANITPKTGNIVISSILRGNETDLIVISQKGQTIRMGLDSISIIGRSAQGVRIMRLGDNDKLASGACM